MWQKAKNYYHLAQAAIAATIFGFPSKKLILIGVTGTDGKTTTVNMIYHILHTAGEKVSMISSVNAQIGANSYDTGFHVSTPSPWQVQKYLKMAVDAGDKYFVLESTSHGLDQNRLAFTSFKVGVLTNITNEHLDYHKKWENYALAKLRLLNIAQLAIINKDDQSYDFLKNKIKGKFLTYSMSQNADLNLKSANPELKIPGDYNVSNALAAIAATEAVGIKKQDSIKALGTFSGVKGRMEKVKNNKNLNIYVDFAHTPNGLEQALKTLKSQAGNAKLTCVFGSAGQRDSKKRPQMGTAADKYANLIVLTSEDPRDEDPKDIAQQVATGIKKHKFHIIINRQEAIDFAVKNAKSGDFVGIFGKGHEKSMNINGKETPWDDFEAVKKALGKI